MFTFALMNKKNIFFTFLFIFTTIIVISQEIAIKGQIIDFSSKKALPRAHVLNLNSVQVSVSNSEGYFSIPAKVNDTLYLSYIGFSSLKLKVTNDLLKGNDLVISLHQKVNAITDVVVKSHHLIGVLEIDAKNVLKDKLNRIHIDGLPQTYETGRYTSRTYNSPVDAIFQPLDFLYNRFGKKPKVLRKLKKLQREDQLRAMLTSNNREVLMEYLDMDMVALKKLLDNCNYSEYYIKNASDLQMIDAVLDCYENHKALKKGSTKR